MSDRIPVVNARRQVLLLSVVVFIVGVLLDVGLQYRMRPYAFKGVYFHPWSSEDMMQTVSVKALRDDPLQTLTHIHIQPPAFDAIRGALVQLWPSLGPEDALVRVDSELYALWALIFGLLGVVSFIWISKQCGTAVGFAGALLLLLHPATIFFATYLDSTLLSAFLVLLAYYLFWKLKNGHPVSVLALSAVTLLLFFTRSIFQLPAILLFAFCLYLFGMPRRQLIAYVLLTGLVGGLYVAKQYYQFGIFSTSSFVGLNLANSIGAGMGGANYSQYLGDSNHLKITDGRLPEVLLDKTKLNGQPNFNNINYLSLNNDLFRRYQKKLLSTPVSELAKSYAENAAIYFKPSSTYSSQNVIVDHLPWTDLYNRFFSAPILPVLLTLAILGWSIRVVRSRAYSKALGILLPGAYILVVSIVSDKGENMRFKFFLEPVMFVFLVSQLYFWARTLGTPRLARPALLR